MPSDRPTLLVRLTRPQYDLLTELAALQKRSRASYLNELLDGAEPILTALLGHMRMHLAAIEGQPVTVRDAVAKILTGFAGDEAPNLLDAIERSVEQQPKPARSVPSGARAHRAGGKRRKAQA